MSIDAYCTVFESSTAFGVRKLNLAVDTKGDLEERVAQLDKEIEALNVELASLTALCISLEYHEDQQTKTYEVRSKDLVDLSAEKTQLEDLLAVLRASKPDKLEDGKK